MDKLRFSGHDTFIVRSFWPKKGYDFVKRGGRFNSEDAVVELGVGKNMVSSIQFWMKALGLIKEDNITLTQIAQFIFDDEEGFDPFLEDIGSIWLLHYFLVKTEYSSIYSLVFNELRKERSVFNKHQLAAFIKRKYAEADDNSINANTIGKDISVFTRLYKKVDFQLTEDFEEEVSSLMIELELVNSTVEDEIKEGTNKREKIEWFHLHGNTRATLPPAVLLFTILDNFNDLRNIGLKKLEVDPNSPGMVFLLSKDALYNQLKELERLYTGIVVSETAGTTVLVLPDDIDKWDILRNYYAN